MKVEIATSLGSITVELDQEKAPKTVENFLGYVKSGFYDGTIFHRVIAGFMIQGGGMDKDMKTKPTNPSIENEANNELSNLLGTIAMARTGDPHSATAQFFINTNDNDDHLDFKTEQDWGYCVFGKVVDGMEVVRSIEGTPITSRNGHDDVPEEIISIDKITVLD